jgi:hypothetical protein
MTIMVAAASPGHHRAIYNVDLLSSQWDLAHWYDSKALSAAGSPTPCTGVPGSHQWKSSAPNCAPCFVAWGWASARADPCISPSPSVAARGRWVQGRGSKPTASPAACDRHRLDPHPDSETLGCHQGLRARDLRNGCRRAPQGTPPQASTGGRGRTRLLGEPSPPLRGRHCRAPTRLNT